MKTIVFSLGGSLIVPDEIDVKFLKQVKALIEKYNECFSQRKPSISKNKINDLYDKKSASADFTKSKDTIKFIIVTGGGKTCRKYQEAAKQLGITNQESIDWIGIAATNLNERLIKEMFGKDAKISKDHKKKISGWKILVGSGIAPGHSTDYDSVLLAKTYKADCVINLTDVEYVYTADPKKDPNARPLKTATWKEYKKIIDSKWIPGMHAPFDPVASQLAEKEGIKVIIINAKNIPNLEAFLQGRNFIGTTIS